MFSMKKILAIAGAGAMLVSVAACGSGTAGDDGGKKEISFQTWNLKNDKYTPYFEALIKAYEKDHPDVTVKWLDAPSDGYEDKLSSQAAAGELPDIVDGGNSILYGLAKAGALLDVSKQAPDAEKDYYEGAVIAEDYQANRLITLSMKNISVADIIGQIRKTTDYRFLFQVDDLKARVFGR